MFLFQADIYTLFSEILAGRITLGLLSRLGGLALKHRDRSPINDNWGRFAKILERFHNMSPDKLTARADNLLCDFERLKLDAGLDEYGFFYNEKFITTDIPIPISFAHMASLKRRMAEDEENVLIAYEARCYYEDNLLLWRRYLCYILKNYGGFYGSAGRFLEVFLAEEERFMRSQLPR